MKTKTTKTKATKTAIRTKVFAYKGYLGILSDPKAEGVLNKPDQGGQLGYVTDAKFVDIQPEALKLLKSIKKSGDCIGDVDVFGAGEKTIFGWLGGPMKMIDPKKVTGSRDYKPSLLRATPNVITPADFIAAVDKTKGK